MVECAGEDAAGFFGRLLAPVELLMIGFDHFGVLNAFLGLDACLEDL